MANREKAVGGDGDGDGKRWAAWSGRNGCCARIVRSSAEQWVGSSLSSAIASNMHRVKMVREVRVNTSAMLSRRFPLFLPFVCCVWCWCGLGWYVDAGSMKWDGWDGWQMCSDPECDDARDARRNRDGRMENERRRSGRARVRWLETRCGERRGERVERGA